MTKTNIGIIGLGSFCTNYHIPHLLNRSDVDVTAVCDVSENRLNARREKLAQSRPFTDHRALLEADRIDGLIVSTPNQFHFEICRDALERNIPVLVDKPITVTHSNAKELVRISKSRDVILMTAFTRHFMSSTEHVRRQIRAGEVDIQRLTAVQRRSGIANTIEDGGMLHRRTVHILDLIPWLTAKPIAWVSGTIEYERDHKEESVVDTRLELEDGSICDLLCIKDGEEVQDEVSVYGRRQSYRLDKRTVYRLEPKSGWQLIEDLPTYGSSTDHFLDVIQGVECDPDAPCADRHSLDGLRSIQVLEAIHQAAQTGDPVEIPADSAP